MELSPVNFGHTSPSIFLGDNDQFTHAHQPSPIQEQWIHQHSGASYFSHGIDAPDITSTTSSEPFLSRGASFDTYSDENDISSIEEIESDLSHSRHSSFSRESPDSSMTSSMTSPVKSSLGLLSDMDMSMNRGAGLVLPLKHGQAQLPNFNAQMRTFSPSPSSPSSYMSSPDSSRNGNRKKLGKKQARMPGSPTQSLISDVPPSPKKRLVWTLELHNRFIEAVTNLGIQAAVPKTILQIMNVEGLTRENVASHLQKYRLTLKKKGLPHCNGRERSKKAVHDLEIASNSPTSTPDIESPMIRSLPSTPLSASTPTRSMNLSPMLQARAFQGATHPMFSRTSSDPSETAHRAGMMAAPFVPQLGPMGVKFDPTKSAVSMSMAPPASSSSAQPATVPPSIAAISSVPAVPVSTSAAAAGGEFPGIKREPNMHLHRIKSLDDLYMKRPLHHQLQSQQQQPSPASLQLQSSQQPFHSIQLPLHKPSEQPPAMISKPVQAGVGRSHDIKSEDTAMRGQPNQNLGHVEFMPNFYKQLRIQSEEEKKGFSERHNFNQLLAATTQSTPQPHPHPHNNNNNNHIDNIDNIDLGVSLSVFFFDQTYSSLFFFFVCYFYSFYHHWHCEYPYCLIECTNENPRVSIYTPSNRPHSLPNDHKTHSQGVFLFLCSKHVYSEQQQQQHSTHRQKEVVDGYVGCRYIRSRS
eukprot:GILK01011069.1.p1 GENE.GILK01011069.1~~GILK01011069.1.p1  ORF type:complete len:694 (-),score=134.35 GILK01011069.1:508-2589(-)